MLKRKFEETADDGGGGGPESATTSNGQSESDDSNCSNSSTDAKSSEVSSGPSPPKRIRKKVNFNGVSVYYFPRKQGFTCVPSEGGSTLGMSEKHTFTRDFSLSDYTKEQKRIHRSILAEQRRQGKMFPSPLLASALPLMNAGDDVSSGSESDSEYDDYYFLQPLPIRQRRVLLRTAGVKKIDNEEKDECRDIRVSRNICGCECKTFCDPATCSCSVAGIQCQVDRLSFPCGCTKDGCANPAGRIEFNPIRVRTHFIHTLMRLELEKTDSQCQEVGPVDNTFSTSSRSSEAAGEIDVESGVESLEMAALSTDAFSDKSCSSTSKGADTNDGTKVLKSRLKIKRTELIDLNMFNSNEKGSCRDCQNTDMCNVMMHDLKFSMVSHQQRQQLQQQRSIPTIGGSQSGYQGPQLQQHHHHHLTHSPGLLLLHPPPNSLPPPQQQTSEHMLLFNDGEEEIYRTENTTSMYFDNDDNSYPDMNDMPPSVLESQPFSSISQSSFSRKFHISQSQMFSSNIGSSNGAVCNQSLVMPKQATLSNPSCIQNLQMNGDCGAGLSSSSFSDVDLDQRRSCGMLMHSHTQQQSTAQSHLAPFLSEETQLSSGQCGGPLGNRISPHGHQSQNGPLTHAHLGNSLQHSVTGVNLMLEGRPPGFQGKLAGTSLLETPVLAATSSYKIDPSMHADTHYSSSNLAGAEKDYLSQPNHLNFVGPTTAGFDNQTTSANGNDGSTRFQSLRPAQHSSCWSASLASPTLRECLGLGTSSPNSSSIADQSPTKQGISHSTIYQQEPCVTASSPPSPDSSTITYATMTATTRDRLAAHCPGISSHMDSRSELPACTLKDSNPSFTNYYMTSDSSNTNRVLEGCQNLMYDLPYPDTSTVDSCTDLNVAFTTTEPNRTSTDAVMNNISSTSATSSLPQPLFTSPKISSSAPTECTSRLYSTEVSSTSMLPISSTLIPSSSSNSPATCQAVMTRQSFNQLPTSTNDTDTFPHNSPTYSHTASCNSLGAVVSAVSLTTPAEEANKVSSNDSCAADHRQSTSEHPDLPDTNVSSWKASHNLTEQMNVVNSCKEEGQELINDVQCDSLSCDIPDAEYEENRNYETCATDSEVISSLSSSAAQSTASSSTSSSSSSPTSEEDKEHNLNQDFGEIIKESIVEMVLV